MLHWLLVTLKLCLTLLNMLFVDPKEKVILVEVEGSPSMAVSDLIYGSYFKSH